MSFFPSFAEEPSVFDIQAPHKDKYAHWAKFSEALMRGPSPLTVAEREMIAAYTSALNECTYCYHDHTMAAEAFGVPHGVLDKLMDAMDAAPVDEKMKPILRFIRKLTETPGRMVQADADAVYAAGWDEHALHDAIAVCARFNFMNRLVLGFGIKYNESLSEDWKSVHGFAYAPKN